VGCAPNSWHNYIESTFLYVSAAQICVASPDAGCTDRWIVGFWIATMRTKRWWGLLLGILTSCQAQVDRSRFWRHHVEQRSLVFDGVNYYDDLEGCVKQQRALFREPPPPLVNPHRRVHRRLQSKHGPVFAVEVINALSPVTAHAVQSLTHCVRQYLPQFYQVRSMASELQDKDKKKRDQGGNTPTHLGSLVSLFLPDVVDQMDEIMQLAFAAAGWAALVVRDELQRVRREDRYATPNRLGIRASEHLSYADFSYLDPHDDGSSLYTLNCALTDSEAYQGGALYILDKHDKNKRHEIKAAQYTCIVFLGGAYKHGVLPFTGGPREMFSTEFWSYPDLPVGHTLWTSLPSSMEVYIEACDAYARTSNSTTCPIAFPNIRSLDPDNSAFEDELNILYHAEDEEPHFLRLRSEVEGRLTKFRWRDSMEQVNKDAEAFTMGLPERLVTTLRHHLQDTTGIQTLAQKILYKDPQFQETEERLYTLEDKTKWTAMRPEDGKWDTDMLYLNPADEHSFENMVAVLGQSGFDMVLQAIGQEFAQTQGLMIVGVSVVILSQFHGSAPHRDMYGTRNSYFAVTIPIHVPQGWGAPIILASSKQKGLTFMRPNDNLALVWDGDAIHGTGQVNYRSVEGFRLSLAVYVADINSDNIDQIDEESPFLWPTKGDLGWLRSQKGRFWREDGSRSMRNDPGRKSFQSEDKRTDCKAMKSQCDIDLTGVRRECPQTCQLYMDDEAYASLLSELHSDGDHQLPSSGAGAPVSDNVRIETEEL